MVFVFIEVRFNMKKREKVQLSEIISTVNAPKKNKDTPFGVNKQD